MARLKWGNPFLRAYVNDFDLELETLVRARGYLN